MDLFTIFRWNRNISGHNPHDIFEKVTHKSLTLSMKLPPNTSRDFLFYVVHSRDVSDPITVRFVFVFWNALEKYYLMHSPNWMWLLSINSSTKMAHLENSLYLRSNMNKNPCRKSQGHFKKFMRIQLGLLFGSWEIRKIVVPNQTVKWIG